MNSYGRHIDTLRVLFWSRFTLHRGHKDFQGPETQAAAISTFTQLTSSTEVVYLPQSCLVDTAGTTWNFCRLGARSV